MGGPLKWLIAITCLVVIAAVGFWTFKTLNDEASAKQLAQERANRRSCEDFVEDVKSGRNKRTVGEAVFCVRRGYIDLERLRNEDLGPLADRVEQFIKDYPAS